MNIREANEYDAPKIAKVHVDAWRSTYKGLIDDDYLKNLSYLKKEKRWLESINEKKENIYVVLDNGSVVGFATCGKERDNCDSRLGEIYAMYILKEFQRKGCGRALVKTCAEKLMKMGADSLIIWMLDGNTAGKFYETLGGKMVREAHINIGETNCKIVAYKWDNIKMLI